MPLGWRPAVIGRRSEISIQSAGPRARIAGRSREASSLRSAIDRSASPPGASSSQSSAPYATPRSSTSKPMRRYATTPARRSSMPIVT
jgi:hypothetical protein